MNILIRSSIVYLFSLILWRMIKNNFAWKPKYQDQAEGPEEEHLAQLPASGRLLSKTQ